MGVEADTEVDMKHAEVEEEQVQDPGPVVVACPVVGLGRTAGLEYMRSSAAASDQRDAEVAAPDLSLSS